MSGNTALASKPVSNDEISVATTKKKEKPVSLFKRPLVSEAVKPYNKPGLIFPDIEGQKHPAPRKYLPWISICFLAQAIGRQLTVEDIKCLLVDDGIATCNVFGKKFRAISWAILGKEVNSRIAKKMKSGYTFGMAVGSSTTFVGSFWMDGEEIVSYSGTPDDLFNEAIREISPLCQKYLKKRRRWGMTRMGSEEHQKQILQINECIGGRCRPINNSLGANWSKTKR